MSDRSDALVVTYRAHGHGRRLVFEPRSDGRHDLVEETLTRSGDWRTVGHEIVDAVSVEGATGGTVVLEGGPP